MAPGLLKASLPQSSVAPLSHPALADLHPASDQLLLSALSETSYQFLQPTASLHTAALVLAKRYLDPLASSISESQQQRIQLDRKKRKRGVDNPGSAKGALRLKQVHLDGFAIEQVWEQARRVLDASRQEVERCLPAIQTENDKVESDRASKTLKDGNEVGFKTVHFDEDGFELGESDESMDDPDGILAEGLEKEQLSEQGTVNVDGDLDIDLEGEEREEGFGEDEDIEADPLLGMQDDVSSDDSAEETFVADRHGLNDGFFSIDDFNRQSEFLEQTDARADPDGGVASDEEEIDWDADPMSQTLEVKPEGDGSSDEGGPTFGNADLNAPDTPSDLESDGNLDLEAMNSMSNTNDIQYAEFFAPPARKMSKTNRHRALPKTQPPAKAQAQLASEQNASDDIQKTIAAVRRDIFEDELTEEEKEDAEAPLNENADPMSRRSNHEKRQALLTAEIRRLEAASVAKRDWTLSGEARAISRPINSLLEEDLEFERTGKPVPVITAQVSEDIESLIKCRILAREFDEVIKRRPGESVLASSSTRDDRRRFELQDTKADKSLAEIYEAEHLASTAPDGSVPPIDAAEKRQQDLVLKLWAEVSSKLDALTSFHYRPKQPAPAVTVINDVPAITMEDARPSGVDDGNLGESMLAPQEIYRVGDANGKVKGDDETSREVIRGGLPVGKVEMTREEKLRRRRREKEKLKKQLGNEESQTKAIRRGRTDVKEKQAARRVKIKKAKEKDDIVGQLKKGGVRMIGQKGDVRNVEGEKVSAAGRGTIGGGTYKL
ncbi:U3 snoRNP protein [Bachmanniomyces sp. S44760]|nr:U3 snoRNP protein [Bachmanniomyces sp. S44760]